MAIDFHRVLHLLARRARAKPTDGAADTLDARHFLRDVERAAQRRAGLVRVAIAILIFVTIAVASEGLPQSEVVTHRQIYAGQVILVIFGLTGLGLYLLARRGLAIDVLPYLTVSIDAALVLGNLAYNHFASGVPGNFTFLFPIVWVVPIALAYNAIYYRTGLQIVATSLYVIGLPAISLLAGYIPQEERAEALQSLGASLGGPPNAVRLVMILAAGFVLILAARQGRHLLDRALRETTLRLNLTRYLPGELAPVLSEDVFEGLRAGRPITVALLFVDIRGSSALGAAMDPADLARFITAFRRRVGRASAQHGGVIDKFIGDGALLVFGVPSPSPTDAARALVCARTLLNLIAAWSDKRGVQLPCRSGSGSIAARSSAASSARRAGWSSRC